MPSGGASHICMSCRRAALLPFGSAIRLEGRAARRCLSYTSDERRTSAQDTSANASSGLDAQGRPYITSIGRYSRKPLEIGPEKRPKLSKVPEALLSQLAEEEQAPPPHSLPWKQRQTYNLQRMIRPTPTSAVPEDHVWNTNSARSNEKRFSKTLRADHPDLIRTRAIARMGRATERSDLLAADRICEEVFEHARSLPNAGDAMVLFEQLALMYRRMDKFHRAKQILARVEQLGLKPSLGIWTSVIRASANVQNAGAASQLWQAMLAQGLKPDLPAYSAVIYAFLGQGQHFNTMNVLDQMGSDWDQWRRKYKFGNREELEVAMKQSDAPLRPTVEIGNAALAGLVDRKPRQFRSLMTKILKWMKDYRLDYNTATYNILLTATADLGELKPAFDILERMRRDGIPQDQSTSTSLMKGLITSKYLDQFKGQEQTRHLLDIIEDIEQNHIKEHISDRAYALAITDMLRKHNNLDAAEQLMDRMRAHKIPITTHIHTVLLDFYLSGEKPNIPAFEQLWEKIAKGDKGWGEKLDVLFYDRALERLSKYHEQMGIEKICQILNQLPKMGIRPSWRSLHEVARAFAARGDTSRLLVLVQNLRHADYTKDHSGRRESGYKMFWSFMFQTGVMESLRLGSVKEMEMWDEAHKPKDRGIWSPL